MILFGMIVVSFYNFRVVVDETAVYFVLDAAPAPYEADVYVVEDGVGGYLEA